MRIKADTSRLSKKIGKRLRYLREARGWSLEDVARKLNPRRTRATVHKWETGLVEIPIEFVPGFARLYGINPNEFLEL